jgi:hypothetical protein
MTPREVDMYLESRPGCAKTDSPLIWGVGINDAGFQVAGTVEGKHRKHRGYAVWNTMLQRCQQNRTHYESVTVAPEWYSFLNFHAWWKKNYKEGYHLDKDILGNGLVYSASTCVFIPSWLNVFLTLRDAKRGDCPLGVSYHKTKKKYIAAVMVDGRKTHLGNFDNPQDAHRAGVTAKLGILSEKKGEIDSIFPTLYPRLVEIITTAT